MGQQQFSQLDPEAALQKHRALLGVRRGCTKAELKQAYYGLAKKSHPDAHGSASGEEFTRLKAAYDALAQRAV